MSKQMILATLCLSAGSALVLTGCQTKAEAAAAREQQQAAEIVIAEEQLATEEIAADPVVITPAEPAAEAEPAVPAAPLAETPAPAPAPVHPKPVAYTVTAGDSVSALAARFNVRKPDILALNPVLRDNPDRLRIGQTVYFPAGTDVTVAPKPRKTAPASSASKGQVVYEVRPGDVLGGIAIRHKVSVDAIRKANNIKNDMIWVGQKLVIPGAVKAVPPAKPVTKKSVSKPAVKKTEPKAEEPKTPVAAEPVPPPAVEETVLPDAVLPPPAAEGDAVPPEPPAAPEAPAESVTTYTVGEGEDLVSISLRWGVSLPALREANGLDASSNAVAPGTTLKIPMVAE